MSGRCQIYTKILICYFCMVELEVIIFFFRIFYISKSPVSSDPDALRIGRRIGRIHTVFVFVFVFLVLCTTWYNSRYVAYMRHFNQLLFLYYERVEVL